jgi:uncharacterized membrane protein
MGLGLVAYAMAGTAVVFGPLQFAFARVLGDLLHEGRAGAFGAALAQLLGPVLAALALVAAGFLAFVPGDAAVRVAAFALTLALGGTWLAMVPLTAARNFSALAAICAAGAVVGAAAALLLVGPFGAAGLLGGLALGQVLVFLGLLARVEHEFGAPTDPVPDLAARLARRPGLLVAGTAYAAGLWVDKAIFWFHPLAPNVPVAGALRVCPPYDNGMALAALTAVPALALFVLLVETDLATRVKAYLATIEARAALPTVEAARAALVASTWRNLGLVALVQGVITLGVVAFSPEIVAAFHQPWLSLYVFRIGAVGACMQVLFLATLVHLLYLDLGRPAAWLAVGFLATDAAFTLASVAHGLPGWGFGFAAAAATSLAAALVVLDGALGDLEYHLFMRQPG